MKKVAAVPPGPTKLKGPNWLLLAATWNFKVVLAGTVAFQLRVPHVDVPATAGLESFVLDVKSPEVAYPLKT